MRTICTVTLALLAVLPVSAQHSETEYIQEIDSWHAQRIERLQSETGWLTLIGLHPLHEGENTLGSQQGMDVLLSDKVASLVGTITIAEGVVKLSVDEGVSTHIYNEENLKPIGYIELATDAEGRPTTIELGSLLFFVIERGEQMYLRVKDRESEVLKNFTGVERFPVDPEWRVTARLEVPESPQTVAITNALGLVEESASPGVLVFELEGKTCRLTPLGEPGQSLFIIMADKTSGHTTYGGGRFLTAPAPAADGTVTLDFNKAYNPPCVFSPYATCPLPPNCNQLPVAVQAGEKNWGEH